MDVTGLESDISDLKEWLEDAGFEVRTETVYLNMDPASAMSDGVMWLTVTSGAVGSVAALVKAVAAYMEARKKKFVQVTREGHEEWEYDDVEELRDILQERRRVQLTDAEGEGE